MKELKLIGPGGEVVESLLVPEIDKKNYYWSFPCPLLHPIKAISLTEVKQEVDNHSLQ